MTLPDVPTELQWGHNSSNSCASTHWLHYMSRRTEGKQESSCLLPDAVLWCKASGVASCSFGGPLSGDVPLGVAWTSKDTNSSLTREFQSLFTCIIRVQIIILDRIIKFHLSTVQVFWESRRQTLSFSPPKRAIWLANMLNKTEIFIKPEDDVQLAHLLCFHSFPGYTISICFTLEIHFDTLSTPVSHSMAAEPRKPLSCLCTLLCCVHPARWIPAGK